MKRLLSIVSIVVVVSMVVCAAPKKKNRNPKVKRTEKTLAKKAEMNEVKTTKQPAVMLTKFKLEYQGAKGKSCANSAVFSASQSEYGDYLYYRGKGNRGGRSYNLYKGACSDLLTELSRIAEQKKLYDYKFTELEDEDVNKSRWLVTLTTTDGKKYSLVEYSDGSELLELVEEAFKPLLQQMKSSKLVKGYSEYYYNSDGSLNYRTDHEADGTVHGGYNPQKPNLRY